MDKEKRREYDRRRREDAKLAYAAFIEFYPLSLDDLPDEQWRPITDKYQVSNYGRVKSFWGKEPLIRKPGLCGEYLSVNLSIDGKKKRRSIHILVARAFIPNPEGKPEVNHDDGNKFNCHVSNLYWATSAENVQHAFDTGLKFNAQGIDDSNSKIKNEADIIYIRDNPDNLTQKQLAEKFSMSQRAISFIQLGKSYANAGGSIREKSEHPHNYISDEIRNQIRADWATGNFTLQQLADKYGVGKRTVCRIIREGQESSKPAKFTVEPLQTATEKLSKTLN